MSAASCCVASGCSSPDCLQLTERENQVCAAICVSSEPVSFTALRESLGFHQEVMSRILRRLVNYRAVEKVRGKYRRVSQ
jgi:DNA-binding HxlR family transcriptional regulator